MIWESLLEDTTAKNIKENMRKDDEKIAAEKVEMKKLPFQEKVTKMAEINDCSRKSRFFMTKSS